MPTKMQAGAPGGKPVRLRLGDFLQACYSVLFFCMILICVPHADLRQAVVRSSVELILSTNSPSAASSG